MEREVLYKNNPTIESEKRLNMAYLLLTNPQLIDVIEKSKGCFFHGTNANALPSILKYGLNSVDTSIKNNIDVTTGEQWSRINGKRSFISLTDCIDVALSYANRGPNDNDSKNSLFNFGVLIGASFENMNDLRVYSVDSDISEIGVCGNLPLDHIKFLAVSDDKVEFVKKLVGQNDIEVVSININDLFFIDGFYNKLHVLEQREQNVELPKTSYPTFTEEDVKPIVCDRKTSKIQEIFEVLKERIRTRVTHTYDKSIDDRG